MENAVEFSRKVIVLHGNISEDFSHVKIKSKDIINPNISFPRSMPMFLTFGLKENGIVGIDINYHSEIMTIFKNVIKENPSDTMCDDLPVKRWVSCIIDKLKSEYTICVIQ